MATQGQRKEGERETGGGEGGARREGGLRRCGAVGPPFVPLSAEHGGAAGDP